MQSPEPGPPHPDADTAQKVLIKSCLLVDATIGNSNKMTVHATSEGGVVEPGGSEEPKGGTGEPRAQTVVCVSAHLTQPSGKGPEQGHSGLGLSGQTKRQHAAPGVHQGDEETEKGIGQDGSRDFWDLE